jgi:hypothetical protein
VSTGGRVLFEGDVGPGNWEQTFAVAGIVHGGTADIVIESSTFRPNGILDRFSRTHRKLGVAVREVVLLKGNE